MQKNDCARMLKSFRGCVRRFIILSTAFFLASALSFAQSVKNIPTTSVELDHVLDDLNQYISQEMKTTGEPGCAVAVVYHNRVVFMKSYGYKNILTREAINSDTVFQLGSISKTFAATLAAILEQRGMLNFEHPVNYYLPSFALRNSASSALKVKHLLNHTTGVPRTGFNTMIERHLSYPKLLSMVKRTPVKAYPGSHFDYHNVVFSVIGDVITRTTRLPYESALQYYVINPLGMRDTTDTFEGLIHSRNRALPHMKTKQRTFLPSRRYSNAYYHVTPAAGVNSSVRDMATYLNLQLGGYPKILGHVALSKLHHPTIHTPDAMQWFNSHRNRVYGAYYGLGWRILNFTDEKIVFHGGWLRGFTNFIGFIPRYNVGIVILHNAETRLPTRIGMHFFNTFLGLPDKQW